MWRQTNALCVPRESTDNTAGHDRRTLSYSGGQPEKWVMKYILQYNRMKQITMTSLLQLVILCGERKHIDEALTLCTTRSLRYHEDTNVLFFRYVQGTSSWQKLQYKHCMCVSMKLFGV